MGLLYAGARHLDPELGIWLSVDPLAGKFPEWSPYNYTVGNPLRFIDPDGKEARGVTYDEILRNGSQLALTEKKSPLDEEDEHRNYVPPTPRSYDHIVFVGGYELTWTSIFGKGAEGVVYDGEGIGGTNYLGPGPNINPYDLLKGGLKYIDELDKAGFLHDVAYYNARTGGIEGAFFNNLPSVVSADLQLVKAASSIIKRFESGGGIDKVTGKQISERTYNMAKSVKLVFEYTLETFKGVKL